MQVDTFEITTKVIFGQDALNYIKNFQDEKVFIVTDPFMVKSGIINKITDYLTTNSYEVFSDIVPDPPMELVVKGVEAVTKFKPNCIIALGGGSAIDAAKAIMDFSRKIGNLEAMKFIAIPTTSGTGSEVTSFAVITDQEKGVKYPLVSDSLLPDIAILEPELVKSVPSSIIADTGMDVLTHAIEAYVSTDATDFSDALAEKAIELVFEYLKRSYESIEDMEAKEKMHNASCLAGLAFNQASLGINHAIAHNIGGKLHVPHGRTNAILLPYVIEFNADIEGYAPTHYTKAAKKYAYLAKLIGVEGANIRSSVRNLMNEIIKLQKDMKMPTSLHECHIKSEDFNKAREDIIKGALEDACLKTNPRKATHGDILEILHKID